MVDACLWIDLNFGDLISEIFQLPHELYSPDVILAELEVVDSRKLVSLGLTKVSARGAEALDEMLRNQARLPKTECQKRFKKWRNPAL